MTDIVKHQAPDVLTLGTVFTKSGYFQDAKEANQAIVKILAGQELGFGPVASMTGINIVKGKVSLSANLIAAAVKRTGKYNYRVSELTEVVCKIVFFEGKEQIGESSFSMDDAKAAGIANENYRKYARNMLFARAMSNGAKWFCADVFGGPVYTPDELGAKIDMETGEMLERPADEPAIIPAVSGHVSEEQADREARELFKTPEEMEREEKVGVLAAIAKGFDLLKTSPPMQLVLWKKHTNHPVLYHEPEFDPDRVTLDAMNALLGELRALHASAKSREGKR